MKSVLQMKCIIIKKNTVKEMLLLGSEEEMLLFVNINILIHCILYYHYYSNLFKTQNTVT